MTNEERKQQILNRNVKSFPLLNALTWDVIFVWTISTMFFTTQKGLSYSQTIMLDSILMLLGCIMVVPINRLFQNVKPITATRIGLLGYGGYLVLCIVGNSYGVFILAQFALAFGYAVMSVKTNSVLTDSLSMLRRDKDYQKIYGQGMSIYYVINCVGAIVITYVYSWQPYVAYWISFGVVIFAELYSLLFKDVSKFQDRNVNLTQTESPKPEAKKPDGYFKILKSSFFVFLLIFMFLIRGILSIVGSSFKVYLQQIIDWGAIPAWTFGYLYAGSRLCCAIASKYQFKFNLKFGVRSIIIITVAILLTFIVPGLLYLQNPTSIVNMVIILIMSYIQMAIYVVCRIFVNNYMQVCMHKKNMERAYSIRTMVEYLGYAAISSVFAALLGGFGDNYGLACLTFIGIFGLPLIISTVLFIKALIKKHAQKYTIVKDEYTKE